MRTRRPAGSGAFRPHRPACALCQASSALHGSERLLAFLDDLYVLTTRERAREARETVVQAMQEGCGIAFNQGKTRVYSHAGGEPPWHQESPS